MWATMLTSLKCNKVNHPLGRVSFTCDIQNIVSTWSVNKCKSKLTHEILQSHFIFFILFAAHDIESVQLVAESKIHSVWDKRENVVFHMSLSNDIYITLHINK